MANGCPRPGCEGGHPGACFGAHAPPLGPAPDRPERRPLPAWTWPTVAVDRSADRVVEARRRAREAGAKAAKGKK